MKVKRTEHGVELTAESDFESECLRHLRRQGTVTIKFEDDWNSKGCLRIEGQSHPWDKR